MFVLKRHDQLRRKRNQPRGLPLFDPASNLNTTNPNPNPSAPGTEMGHANANAATLFHSPTTLSTVSPAHVQTPTDIVPPDAYRQHGTIRRDGTITSLSPFVLNDSHPMARGDPFADAGNSDAGHLPSPYDMYQPPSPWTPTSSSIETSHSPSDGHPRSVVYGEMVAYQKALEQDDNKSHLPSGSGNRVTDMNDPPPVYTD
jgi:hypothetical protein